MGLGYKSTLKAMRSGKSKLVLISGNTPPLRRSGLEYYAMLSHTPVHLYQGSNVAPEPRPVASSASVSSRSRTPVTRTSSRSRPSKLLDANLWKEGEGTHLDSRADRKERYFQGRTTLL